MSISVYLCSSTLYSCKSISIIIAKTKQWSKRYSLISYICGLCIDHIAKQIVHDCWLTTQLLIDIMFTTHFWNCILCVVNTAESKNGQRKKNQLIETASHFPRLKCQEISLFFLFLANDDGWASRIVENWSK